MLNHHLGTEDFSLPACFLSKRSHLSEEMQMKMGHNKHFILISFCAAIILPTSFSEHFGLSSSRSVIGKVDSDVVLPCQISLGTQPQNMQVQWKKTSSSHVSVYQFTALTGQKILGQDYQGRATMVRNGLASGNVSLILKKVQVADEGTYSCIVKSIDWIADTQTFLYVAAVGKVSIEILGPEDNGIKLACRATGWFPKPELHCLANEKQISHQSESKQDQKQLYSVSSSLMVLEDASEIICLVHESRLQMGQNFTISLSKNIFPRTSPWLPAFWIVFILACFCFGAAAYLMCKVADLFSSAEKQKKQSEEEKMFLQDVQTTTKDAEFHQQNGKLDKALSELEFRKARSYMVPIQLDPQCYHTDRATFEDQRNGSQDVHPQQLSPKVAAIMVGAEGFEKGRQYWEVRVDDKLDWELGVLTEDSRDKVKKGKGGTLQEDQHWSLRRSNEKYQPEEANNKIQGFTKKPHVIGIYLNRKNTLEPTVSFYHVEGSEAIVTIPVNPSGKLYPFVSSLHLDGGDTGKFLTICQDKDWDFPERISKQDFEMVKS